MNTITKSSRQFKDLSWNRLGQSNPKRTIKKITNVESIRRLQALRNSISDLKLQCEELRIVLSQNLPEINHCAKCGEHVMQDEAVTYKLDAESRVFCKVCFTEILK